jgi:hypothetical protein
MNASLKLQSSKTDVLSSLKVTFIVQKGNTIAKELDNSFVKYPNYLPKITITDT